MFGYFELSNMNYLILIDECAIVGQIMKSNVYKVTKLSYVPISENPNFKIPVEDQ